MKPVVFIAPMLLAVACLAPSASAQVSVGGYGDYTHLAQLQTNLAGVGARLGVNVFLGAKLEGQLTYDFEQTFTEKFTTSSGGVRFANSNLKVLKGLFGPMIETPGRVKFFVTAKGGFIDFMFNPTPASFSTFTTSISTLRANNVKGMFYPGGGLMANVGPVGLRLDVGDDIYFANGAHHDLVVQVGPVIHF